LEDVIAVSFVALESKKVAQVAFSLDPEGCVYQQPYPEMMMTLAAEIPCSFSKFPVPPK
jgi:hypothetical protein